MRDEERLRSQCNVQLRGTLSRWYEAANDCLLQRIALQERLVKIAARRLVLLLRLRTVRLTLTEEAAAVLLPRLDVGCDIDVNLELK